MDRTQHLLAVLQYDLANGYELRIVDGDGDWLARHAGGFSPICETDEGDCYEVMPDRVVEMGQHLSDEEFTRFAEAIRLWQKSTLLEYAFGLRPSAIVAGFCEKHPDEGRRLRAVARHHAIDTVAFFGADHHPHRTA